MYPVPILYIGLTYAIWFEIVLTITIDYNIIVFAITYKQKIGSKHSKQKLLIYQHNAVKRLFQNIVNWYVVITLFLLFLREAYNNAQRFY